MFLNPILLLPSPTPLLSLSLSLSLARARVRDVSRPEGTEQCIMN